MTSVAIVEDDPVDEALIRTHLEKVSGELGEQFEVSSFGCAEDFLASRPTRYQIALLDIELPGMNGIACARELRRSDQDAAIVFVTNLFQFALEGYDVRAVDFLVKPLRYAGFKAGIARALVEAGRHRPTVVELPDGRSPRLVDASAVAYVETKGRRVGVHMVSGPAFTCAGPLREVERVLEPLGFFLVHQSFLVNMAHVESVGQTEVMVCGEAVPMSRHRRGEFLRAYAGYVRRSF